VFVTVSEGEAVDRADDDAVLSIDYVERRCVTLALRGHLAGNGDVSVFGAKLL
jgi:hypothetical protein